MGWLEFLAWLRAMNKQREGVQASPDSWAGADRDEWWQQARRQREQERRG